MNNTVSKIWFLILLLSLQELHLSDARRKKVHLSTAKRICGGLGNVSATYDANGIPNYCCRCPPQLVLVEYCAFGAPDTTQCATPCDNTSEQEHTTVPLENETFESSLALQKGNERTDVTTASAVSTEQGTVTEVPQPKESLSPPKWDSEPPPLHITVDISSGSMVLLFFIAIIAFLFAWAIKNWLQKYCLTRNTRAVSDHGTLQHTVPLRVEEP